MTRLDRDDGGKSGRMRIPGLGRIAALAAAAVLALTGLHNSAAAQDGGLVNASLARIAGLLAQRTDLGQAMQKSGVWRSREGLVRAAVGRHTHAGLLGLLQASGYADAAAKGQSPDDPWQLAADIVLQLATGGRRAA